MKVTFYYDYICPFSYIGTKRMEKLKEELELDVTWVGIEIHPDYPATGKPRKKTPRLIHITQTLKDIAKADNTEISLPGFITNSRLCLESAEFAKTIGKFEEFHKAAYESLFRHRENIGDIKVIRRIATRAGIDPDELEQSLRKREMKNRIEENKKQAENNMVLGVPTIYFNEFRVHGVQTIEDYKQLIMKETERQKKRNLN